MDAMTAVVGFLGGGAVGASISAFTSSRIAKAGRRDKAAETLWQYHYSLAGFAARAGDELQDDQYSLLDSEFENVRKGLQAAYPYAGYLSAAARGRLFTRARIAADNDPSLEWYEKAQTTHNVFSELAEILEAELQLAFPQRFGDRFRGFRARRKWRRGNK
jgi:hypothetical protein